MYLLYRPLHIVRRETSGKHKQPPITLYFIQTVPVKCLATSRFTGIEHITCNIRKALIMWVHIHILHIERLPHRQMRTLYKLIAGLSMNLYHIKSQLTYLRYLLRIRGYHHCNLLHIFPQFFEQPARSLHTDISL